MSVMVSSVAEGFINGIDVCPSLQKIDPILIKAAGFDFVYIQSSRYSSIKENEFLYYANRCAAAGLRVGAYHFCSHDTAPEAQAEFFFKASSGFGKNTGELPPMLDWEHCTPSKYPDHPQHCVDWISRCAAKVKSLWYPGNGPEAEQSDNKRSPVIYTYPNYGSSHQPSLSQAVHLNDYPLCYASYDNTGSFPKELSVPWHPLPKPWADRPNSWKLWQYSGDAGRPVPGVSGKCDRQVFNGSQGEWAEFLGIKRPADSITFSKK